MKSWELVREEQGLSGEWRVIRREACKGSDKLVSKFTLFNYFFLKYGYVWGKKSLISLLKFE